MKTNDKLSRMIGRTYLYKSNQIVVNNYALKGDSYQIATDKNWIDVPVEDIKEFFDECEIVSNKAELGFAIPKLQIASGDSILNLKEVILSNIKTLQTDKEFIGQASAVNDQIKSFIDLAKVEVEMVKIMRGK